MNELHGLAREALAALWAELLLFLDMVAASKQFVSPPPPVDIAWHAFILHTRDYEAYCRERYGRIIHHQPTGKPDPHAYQRAYQTRTASQTPVDNTIWPVPVPISAQADDGPSHPGQSGDFAAGAATIGGADFGSQGATGGDFGDRPGGDSGDFAPGAGDGPGGGDFGSGDPGGGDSGGSSGGDSGGGDSGGSSCCGGSSCGGGGGD